ncbi:MAG: aldo/keto reductase [Alphaproteobacteria bacterium]|nr:aldo/keto reductase [Alphaproteobacteria bacterium]
MDYVRLGRSSLRVSRIALGAMGIGAKSWRSWVLTEEESRPIVRKAVEAGINLFDTCDYYSAGASETILGKLLREMTRRDEVVIATKLGMNMGKAETQKGFSRKHIVEACEASLKRLGVDYIDLYQTHIWDPTTDIEEMVAAFDDLVRAGKVLYVGATDMPCWQFAKAFYTARLGGRHAFASMQNHYNLIWREDERELIPFCKAEGIGLLPYSPMGRGYLCGAARNKGTTTERSRTDDFAQKLFGRASDLKIADLVDEVAKARGLQSAQVSLAWVLTRHPTAAPIIGATRSEHMGMAVAALEVKLEPADLEKLEKAYEPRPRGGHF